MEDAQRQSGLARAPPPKTVSPPSAASNPTQATLPLPQSPAADERPGKALKPWIEVALPHPDVIANRFKEAEFAADLFAVDTGHASDAYATPTNFFGITFLTEGLKRVLTSPVKRLGDTGGDPVIGLQTSFGGGKTHHMPAIYHLARHLSEGGDASRLAGLGEIVEKTGARKLPKPKIAVFVGSADGPDVSLKIDKGPRVHTVWGYIAWRLAGEKGLALVAEAEAARTSPGSRVLVEVFKLAGPSIILLNELTMFPPPAADDRLETLLSLLHSLTQVAHIV